MKTDPETYNKMYEEERENFLKTKKMRGGRVTAPESKEIVANGGRESERVGASSDSGSGLSESDRSRLRDMENETEDNKQMIWENRILLRVVDERTANLAKIIVGVLVTVVGGLILSFITFGM